MFVMHANRARVISCPIQSLLVCPLVLRILFFQMFGVQLPPQSVVFNIMSASLMITPNLPGFTCCVINLKFFSVFKTSKVLWRDSLTKKSGLCKPIGGVNIKHLILSSNASAFRILFPAHMLISRMDLPSANIDT